MIIVIIRAPLRKPSGTVIETRYLDNSRILHDVCIHGYEKQIQYNRPMKSLPLLIAMDRSYPSMGDWLIFSIPI